MGISDRDYMKQKQTTRKKDVFLPGTKHAKTSKEKIKISIIVSFAIFLVVYLLNNYIFKS
jgi:hypothetical protein